MFAVEFGMNSSKDSYFILICIIFFYRSYDCSRNTFKPVSQCLKRCCKSCALRKICFHHPSSKFKYSTVCSIKSITRKSSSAQAQKSSKTYKRNSMVFLTWRILYAIEILFFPLYDLEIRIQFSLYRRHGS